jgi:hypothetical protein
MFVKKLQKKNFEIPVYRTPGGTAKKILHAPIGFLTPFPPMYKFPYLGLYPRSFSRAPPGF